MGNDGCMPRFPLCPCRCRISCHGRHHCSSADRDVLVWNNQEVILAAKDLGSGVSTYHQLPKSATDRVRTLTFAIFTGPLLIPTSTLSPSATIFLTSFANCSPVSAGLTNSNPPFPSPRKTNPVLPVIFPVLDRVAVRFPP